MLLYLAVFCSSSPQWTPFLNHPSPSSQLAASHRHEAGERVRDQEGVRV